MKLPHTIVDVPPRFRVATAPFDGVPDERTIVISHSAAFGDGRHESTRMCLQALAVFAAPAPFRMLDVGSGSGILSIAAAKLGGSAVGVEIDADANIVAAENARLSGVTEHVTFGTGWPDETFDVVVANILRPILIDLAPEVVRRLSPRGVLIASGLVSTDVPEMIARYGALQGGSRPEIFERDSWRTLVWRPHRSVASR